MIFINNTPAINPEVQYAGHTIPPKEPIASVPVDPNVTYAGYTLPAQKAPVPVYIADAANNPSALALDSGPNVIFFPQSTQIIVKGDKMIAQSQIIDGVTVFEHVSRKAAEIDFEVLIWDSSYNAPFPQQQINQIWNDVFLPNSVMNVTNTYLNGLGILSIIFKDINAMPRLGSTNVILKLKAYENQIGQSIIMS